MSKHPVVWFEVTGKDGAKLQKYYAELFGWTVTPEGPMNYGTVDTGAKAGIPGGITATYPNARPWVTFYVRTDDVGASVGRALELGGKVLMPPMKLPDGMEIAVFEDPEGHPVGLVKDAGAPAA